MIDPFKTKDIFGKSLEVKHWKTRRDKAISRKDREIQSLKEKIKLLEAELAKERGVVDYYGSDIWDLCEDIVSGNQRSCIQYGDDDGSDIFGGVRARQRIKERNDNNG